MAILGEQTIGSIVKLNVNGVATDFIVVHHGLPSSMYDNSCDGTWLLMKDIYTTSSWGSNRNYTDSNIHNYLNNTFFGLFDSNIQSVIKQVKLPCVISSNGEYSVVTGSNGISAKIFLLSEYEVGLATYAKMEDGAKLDYFMDGVVNDTKNALRIAYYNGNANTWLLRTINVSNEGMINGVAKSGHGSLVGKTSAYGIRPAFIMPINAIVTSDGLIAIPPKAISGKVTINGVQRELTGKGYVNINGVLRPLVSSQVNIGGVLRDLRPVYTWKKYNVTTTTGTSYVVKKSAKKTKTFYSNTMIEAGSSYTFDASLGRFVLNNKTTIVAEAIGNNNKKYFILDSYGITVDTIMEYVEKTVSWAGDVQVSYYELTAELETIKVRGSYITNVTSENASAYPTNGIHTDGYWYVRCENDGTPLICPITINSEHSYFENGMTWKEWVESDYSDDHVYHDGTYVFLFTNEYITLNWEKVLISDYIIKDQYYDIVGGE